MGPPYSARFRLSYNDISPMIGCYHIHAPEHIAKTHRFGAPGFSIDSVKPPRFYDNAKRSIEFECRTFNMPIHVFMSRRSMFESELIFTKRNEQPVWLQSPLNNYNFFMPTKGGAFLRLYFEVMAVGEGHDLGVTFTFWNPFIFLLVPLFPLFVAINGIEDMFYLRDIQTQGIPEDKGTWFDLYRRDPITIRNS